MQHIVIEKPYSFISPHRGNWWPNFIQQFRLIDRWLRRRGIDQYECRNVDRLRQSLDRGHGILLTPNHCRPADPIVMGFAARHARTHVYAMASWHLFNQDRFTRWAIHKMGAFSVNREGIDRQAINTAIQILKTAERPLILFPEGGTTRTNDHLHHLMDGVAFIARTAAKKRARRNAQDKVVVHPVAIKYLFQDDLRKAIIPVLAEIEHRLTWQEADHLPLLERINRIDKSLLSLKEIEYLGKPQNGPLDARCHALIDRLLLPLEQQWLGGQKEIGVVSRVKSLRTVMVPEMTQGKISTQDRELRWRHLYDMYLAQQISCYPPDYLESLTTVDRILETVERFEEDLTDKTHVYGSTKVVVDIGEAIPVDPERDRSTKVDPLMVRIQADLQVMMQRLAIESPTFHEEG